MVWPQFAAGNLTACAANFRLATDIQLIFIGPSPHRHSLHINVGIGFESRERHHLPQADAGHKKQTHGSGQLFADQVQL